MQKIHKPNEAQLRELYAAASEFKEAQPWSRLCNDDIICVEDPKDKTLEYCCIMGIGGEHYALGVYLGNEGFYGLYQIMEHGDTMPKHEFLECQNCLMCSFEDRNLLTNEDRKQIKELGLSFRGRNAWPMFRRYEPGYFPWYINEEECVLLTHALRQTLIVAKDLLAGRQKLDKEHGKTIVRYSEEKDGKLEWHSKEMEMGIPSVSYGKFKVNDEVLFQKLKKSAGRGDICLQIDTSYMSSAVQDKKGERPYYPRLYLAVEPESGLAIDYETYGNSRDDVKVVLNKVINFCLERGFPKEIQIRGERMSAILGDFCEKAGIPLKKVKRLRAVDECMKEMSRMM